MKNDFGAAMRQALQLTRAQNLMEATKVIQRALAGLETAAPAADQPRANAQALPPPPKVSGTADASIRRSLSKRRTRARPTRRAGLPGARGVRSARFCECCARSSSRAFVVGPPRRRGLRQAPPVAAPEGAAWLARSFACAAGARDYKLYVPSSAEGRTVPADRHAARLHPGARRLRGRHGHEPARRGARLHRRLSGPAFERQPFRLLELVRSRQPAPRPRRTGDHRGAHPRRHGGVRRRPGPRLCGGPLGRRRHGRHSRRDLSRALRGRGRPLGAAARRRRRPALGLRRHARRREADGGQAAAEGQRPHHRLSRANDSTVHPSNAEAILADVRAGLSGPAQELLLDGVAGGRAYTRTIVTDARGVPHAEAWAIDGLGHAWSGGSPEGSFTDAHGPDASREMLRFFLETA